MLETLTRPRVSWLLVGAVIFLVTGYQMLVDDGAIYGGLARMAIGVICFIVDLTAKRKTEVTAK